MIASLGQLLMRVLDVAPGRIMAALGIGLLSTVAVVSTVNGFIEDTKSTINSIPSDILWLVSMAGVIEGMGIVIGAVVFRLALGSVTRFVSTQS